MKFFTFRGSIIRMGGFGIATKKKYLIDTDDPPIPEVPSWYNLFKWLWVGDIENNQLVAVVGNNINIIDNDINTNYIPYNSNSIFEFENNMTVLDLISVDMINMPVKYDNSEPYHIRMMGILKDDVIITKETVDILSTIFDLNIFWSGQFNDNGVVKENRNYQDLNEVNIVNYLNDGVITSISDENITYDDILNNFIVPLNTSEFSFLDDGNSISFNLVGNIWIPRYNYLDSYMVHRWTFDNDNTDDSIGSANGITVTNINYVNDSDPIHGRSAVFNGNSKIRTTSVAAPDYSGGGYSFVCRFKPTSNGAIDTSYIFLKESYSNGTSMRFGFYQDTDNRIVARWLTGGGGQRNVSTPSPVSLNQYYTAVASWSGTFFEFFLNKTKQGQSTEITTFYLDTYPFLFGSSHDGVTNGESTRKFTGEISSAYIIRKHLSQKEIDYITDFGHYSN